MPGLQAAYLVTIATENLQWTKTEVKILHFQLHCWSLEFYVFLN